MSDILWFAYSSAIICCGVLWCIEYARSKPKNIKYPLIGLIILVFSLLNGWLMNVNQNKLPLDAVESKWNEYADYCRQEHISWSEITFPEWLSLECSE